MVSAIWFHHFYVQKVLRKCEKIEIILTYFVKSTIFSFS